MNILVNDGCDVYEKIRKMSSSTFKKSVDLRDIFTDGVMGFFSKNPQAQECHLSLNKNGSNRLPKMNTKFMISLIINPLITEVH